MNLREILAEAFRFQDHLASDLRARIGALARIATEALDLLLQPRNLSGSLLDGGRNRFVVGLVELEAAQQAHQFDIVRADPGLVQVPKEFGLVLIGEISDKGVKQCWLGLWCAHGSLSGLFVWVDRSWRIGLS